MSYEELRSQHTWFNRPYLPVGKAASGAKVLATGTHTGSSVLYQMQVPAGRYRRLVERTVITEWDAPFDPPYPEDRHYRMFRSCWEAWAKVFTAAWRKARVRELGGETKREKTRGKV